MNRIRVTLFIATPVLFFFSFPPFATNYLSFIALVPFFGLIEYNGYRSGFRSGYAAGLLSLGMLLYWLNWNSGADPWQATGMYVATVFYLALSWGIFSLILSHACRAFGSKGMLAAPFIWTALDYFHSFGELGFTWHSLATPLSVYPALIQYISCTGMFALTFWVVSINTGIYVLIKLYIDPEYREQWVSPGMIFSALAGIMLIPALWSILIKPDQEAGPRKTVTVAIVQPNIEPNRKWLEKDFAYNTLMRQTRSLRGRPKDLIIWPETAIPVRLRWDQRKLNAIISEITLQHTALLTGIPDKRFTVNPDGSIAWRNYNSVYLIRQDSAIETYDKLHLVPLGEYVPDILFLIKNLAMEVGASDYSAGDSMVVFKIDKTDSVSGPPSQLAFSSVICLESVFPALVREGVRGGAEFLIIVTNDAWYDATMAPEQHAQIAVLRAIENRIPVIRCANSGVSCVIDPSGRIISQSRNPSEAILCETVAVGIPGSFYSRHGDWFPVMICVISAGIIGWMIVIRIRKQMRIK